MFGDDPDPTVITEWVGFERSFGCAREVVQEKAMEIRGGLMGSEKREKRAVQLT